MFTETKSLFLYCVSPLHMGGGTALGLIDNPIQREVHTGHPVVAASGLKGAVRHHLHAATLNSGEAPLVSRVFGPKGDANLHAGAVSFSDAQILAFPVRSLRSGFVYACSPLSLGRAKRLLACAGIEVPWEVPAVAEGVALVAGNSALNGDQLVLETSEYKAETGGAARQIAEWLAAHAVPAAASFQYFREKIQQDLVILSEEEFAHFSQNATLVEPHVRINDITGTADDGGLFYSENLPPESILVGNLLVSRERCEKDGMDAAEIMDLILTGRGTLPGLGGATIQVGGNSTTGRGLVTLTAGAA